MIRYNLRCEKGHAFESWFQSSAAYESQEKRRLVSCPACGSDKEKCPGITCHDCSGSGDCTLSCAAGHTQTCIAHPDDPNLRCAYCN